MKNIVLFGKPGSGKGTQANFLKQKYKLVHISTGDLFRNHIKNETPLGKLVKSYTDKGDLVPDSVTIDMLRAEVNLHSDSSGFIFDGFPRTVSQAEALDNFLNSKIMSISAVIALDVEDDFLIKRLLKRGLESGRSDDQDEGKIRNRFKEYNQKTLPLIEFYDSQDKFRKVSGVGSLEEITERLSKVIDIL